MKLGGCNHTILKLKTLQTRIHALNNMLPRETAVVDRVVTVGSTPVDLRGNNKVVSLPAVLLNRLTHRDLALTTSVSFRAICTAIK